MSLLRDEPWGNGLGFSSAVGGYVSAMETNTDWRKLRSDLAATVEESRWRSDTGDSDRSHSFSGKVSVIDRAIANQWARHDLRAAIDWYVEELGFGSSSQDVEDRTVQVLRSLPTENLWDAVDWIDAQRRTENWSDRIVVEYAKALRNRDAYEVVEHLIQVPVNEQDRLEIVEAFVASKGNRPGNDLGHPSEDLSRLVEAANLSPSEHQRWLDTISAGVWTQ